ncbi:MAG: hypothetical protein NT066_03100 [Candidatus Omnitrophica bacterium]|nr:hypothetical protein [Candidatus Omnitrophota bacterium]
MTDYLDDKGKKIQKGFYEWYNNLFYFTGDYDIEEFPILEIEGNPKQKYSLYVPLVQELSKINKESLKEEMKESKEKAKWIEEILKQIELPEIISKTI